MMNQDNKSTETKLKGKKYPRPVNLRSVWFTRPTPVSLRDKIYRAKTVEEVNQLLEKGATYEGASQQTRRQWDAAAKARIKALQESGSTTRT